MKKLIIIFAFSTIVLAKDDKNQSGATDSLWLDQYFNNSSQRDRSGANQVDQNLNNGSQRDRSGANEIDQNLNNGSQRNRSGTVMKKTIQ